jgi:hypothetical protein
VLVLVFRAWQGLRRRRKWKLEGWPLRVLATAATFLFVSRTYVFTTTDEGGGITAGLRLLAKLVFIDL